MTDITAPRTFFSLVVLLNLVQPEIVPFDPLTQKTRLVVLESGLGLESGLKSIFAGLGLGL